MKQKRVGSFLQDQGRRCSGCRGVPTGSTPSSPDWGCPAPLSLMAGIPQSRLWEELHESELLTSGNTFRNVHKEAFSRNFWSLQNIPRLQNKTKQEQPSKALT
ncbi:unnamed protein product [Rangifer tarandus platyrhynchus]|uniref:Uncharacterized protein n=2 Tax=Rangifer tarandus platyrhynchus TaxID=3082113 RepID=A0ACB1MJX0_RANTA|nr:unnamed protein product [Rangifer tarandus platyrhynchus]